MAEERRYRCPECGWIGTEGEMEADALTNGDGWSNWICPACQEWLQLGDYEPVNSRDQGSAEPSTSG